jgi:pimeloyl-ACP methyl ester carboxylesterase
MRILSVAAEPGVAAPICVALVAGASQEPEHFLEAGFAAAVRERGLALDLKFIAPQMQHLLDRSALDRLRRDVVAPARAAGCRSLWLGGVSLGGFFALCYAERHPSDLDGICLLAPYLGNRLTIGRIERAGGFAAWHAETRADGNAERCDGDEEQSVWRYLHAAAHSGPRLHLGYGIADRFAGAHRLLGAGLPASAVDAIDGDHDWFTWRRLWNSFLDKLAADFPQCAIRPTV